MKKIILAFSAASLIFASGCLKDNVNQPNPGGSTSPTGVGFTQAANGVALGFLANSTPQTMRNIYVGLNTSKQEGDITSTIVSSPSLVPADLDVLPASAFTFTTSSVIKAGKYVDTLAFTIADASALDPNASYGVVLTITSASNGAVVAENSKNVLIKISVKNQYDGRYIGKGYGNLGGNTTAPHLFSWNCAFDINLTTTGPNSVDMDAQPLFRGSSTGYGFSNVIPQFTFDPVTNKVTSVTPASTVSGSISFQYPVDGGTYDSRWDPATKTIYVHFGLNGSATWRITDTLTWCAPR